MTTKRRVYYRKDGQVAIVSPVGDPKKGETEGEWLKRVYEKTPVHQEGLLFDDVEVTDLPSDRSKRKRWRGVQGSKIKEDDTLLFPDEELKSQVESEKLGLPTWAQVESSIDNADSLVKIQAILKKIARPVYSYLKKTVD